MRFASILLLAAATAAATAAAQPARPLQAPPPPDARTLLTTQISDEQTTLDKTLATVKDKLSEADRVRLERLRAAYRLLRAPLRTTATADERMAAARRRAAARLLIDRDAAERALLSDETKHLADAQTVVAAEVTQVTAIQIPETLLRPAKGTIARTFGTLEHERSKAILSRRGIDIEVETHAAATAPADGVVRYAGPIRGLDAGVVLDHGSYYTVLAKLDELIVPVGAKVLAGDRVGHAARSRVYFEVRVKLGPGGLPIDPVPLFDKRPAKPR